ncbi:MAG: chemotaxis protein CheA [Halieaceae bacterium]|jgi:two-component system, chemotaxis family, sensor kinase CheA|nr:chemotaxis protein CheA [Halieaceae bacterium]
MSDENLQIFAEEAEDLLAVAEQALLHLDDLDNPAETEDGVGDLFRTFHTIKGAAGLFGLDPIVNFTHIVESVLGNIREGTLAMDQNLVSLFLLSRDHLENLVGAALAGVEQLDDDLEKVDSDLVGKLNDYLGKSAAQEQESNGPATSSEADPDAPEGVASTNWHVSLRYGPNALQNGMDPASFIGYLNTLGEIEHLTLIDDAIPPWTEFDPENCYLGFEIEVNAPDTTKEALEEVFEFVMDDCKVAILPPHSHIEAYKKMIAELPETDMRIGDILLACGALTDREKDDVLNAQDRLADEAIAGGEDESVPQLGSIAVGKQVVQQEVVDAAIKKQSDLKSQRENAMQTVRVNSRKLESLVNLVGELVIGSANAELNARRLADANLNEAMENLLRLVEEVRDTTLGLRMVQIGETFSRFKRVVREVSRDLGKDIDLRISGAETELDKTLVEKIGDPLMHLVRNAIDHGIESPQVRRDAGKPATGTVFLEAFHDSGSIVIRIRDDGGGLSKDKILNKAIEKGLVQAGQQLTEQEIYRLILEAGFSTADSVSNLSGRGVGMDVVRRNIETLRGQVEIASEEGKGSTVTIRLPLTLAIIDGFQVRVGDTQYIIPLDMVDECLELNDALRSGDSDANYVNLRGEILPFMRLSDMFDAERETHDKHRDHIVVVKCAGKRAGFVVDELLGEHQTVIRPLGKVFQNLREISGSTILGSGEVAMIIDIPEMVNKVIASGQLDFSPSGAVH